MSIKFQLLYLQFYLYFQCITWLSAYCLFLFMAPLSNPFTLGKCILTLYLRSTIFPFWDISPISGNHAGSGCTVCILSEMKMTTCITFFSSGCQSTGPHRAAVMDIQMSVIRDIMICRRLLPAVQRLIVFRCLMRSYSLRHSPPQPSNVVDIY